jgi:glycosyltransferase involved in cell wall biosynthesis
VSQNIRILGPVPPPYGGVSVYVDRIRKRLRNNGIRIWSYPYKPDQQANTTFFHHRRLGIIPLVFQDGYATRVLDASHFHLEHPNVFLVPLWLLLIRLFRIEWVKMIFDGTLPSRYQQFNQTQRFLFRLATHRVAEFVVVHEDLAHWLRDEIKVTQPVTTIPCLIAPPPDAQLKRMSPGLNDALARYFMAEKRVCSIGAFVPTYGFKDVAQAVEMLRNETGLQLALLLMAGGFAQDDRYREQVLGGRDWITVLEDVSNDEVFPILKSSDVFVRGNIEEGYGISRVEAIWSGVPVVATNVGETRGMLTYKFGDIESLKQQLRRAIFQEKPDDAPAAPAMFHQEAERNLEDLKRVLGLTMEQ